MGLDPSPPPLIVGLGRTRPDEDENWIRGLQQDVHKLIKLRITQNDEDEKHKLMIMEIMV